MSFHLARQMHRRAGRDFYLGVVGLSGGQGDEAQKPPSIDGGAL